MSRRLILVLLAALVATNQFLDFQRDHDFIARGAGDIISYRTIALAAPELPPPGSDLPFHHGQRFLIPYIVGLVHAAIPVADIDRFSLPFVLAFLFATAALLDGLLERLGVGRRGRTLLILVYLMNPYVTRHYIMAPAVLADTGFGLGVIIGLTGLVEGRFGLTLAGMAFAALCRQTTLFVAPFFVIAQALGLAGRRRNWMASFLLILIPVAIYLATAWIAARYSEPSMTAEHLTGIVTWARESFNVRAFGEFAVRGLIPFSTLVALTIGLSRRSPAFNSVDATLLVIALAICAQPFLGGPIITGQAIARLDCLALPVFILLAGRRIGTSAEKLSSGYFAAIAGLLALGSMHHIYSCIGSLSSERAPLFALMTLVVSALVIAIGWNGVRKVRSS